MLCQFILLVFPQFYLFVFRVVVVCLFVCLLSGVSWYGPGSFGFCVCLRHFVVVFDIVFTLAAFSQGFFFFFFFS